jgi:hypothetical protein
MNGSAGTCSLRGFQILIGSVDLDAWKIPARKAEFSLTENALFPFQAEPKLIQKRAAPDLHQTTRFNQRGKEPAKKS